MPDLLYREETGLIIGAAMEVYNELGPGFLEAVYQEAMEIELGLREILNVPQQELQVYYKGRPLKKKYNADFVCYGKIIVELKAIEGLTNHDEAQLFNYLSATKFELGLLFNFGSRRELEWRRRINTELRNKRK